MANAASLVSALPLATPAQAAETPCFCTQPYEGEHEAVQAPCGHIFARPCIATWCSTLSQANANKCPTCRAELFKMGAAADDEDDALYEIDGVPVTRDVYFAHVRDVLQRFRLVGERLEELRGAGGSSAERGEERVEREMYPENASLDEQERWFDHLWGRAPRRG